MHSRFIACVCVVCNERHDNQIFPEYLCHHCGRPLCRRDTVTIPRDHSFSLEQGTVDSAAHCKKCARKFHRRFSLSPSH